MLHLLRVRPEERRKVLLLLLHYVWVVAVTIAGKAVRDTYFLSRYDRKILPLMAVAAGIAVAVSVALFAKVEQRLRPKILAPLVTAGFAGTLAVLHFRLEGITIPILYVWMEVINVISILQFWLLAAELVDARQAKRLFPIIAGGGSLAAILIGPQLKPFSKAYGSDTLLWLVCALLLGAALLAMVTTRLPTVAAIRATSRSQGGGWKKLSSPYLVTIASVVVCAAFVSAIVDYQFKIISSETLRTETDLVGFFGQFYAVTGFSTLILQFVIAGFAFQRFGAAIVMGVLPLTLGLGSLSILVWPVLTSAVIARFSDQTFRFTLHNGGLELLWLPVAPELRRQTKPFIGGSLKSIAEGVIGLLMYVLLYFLTPIQLSGIALVFCGIWVVALVKLKSLYIAELQSAIAVRRLPPEDLEVSATDALTVRVIDQNLSTGDTLQQLLALELIADIPLAPWRETIHRLLDQGAPEIKVRILQLAAGDRNLVTAEALERLANGGGRPAVEAIRAIGKYHLTEMTEVVRKRLDDSAPAIHAAACAALIRLNESESSEERGILTSMLRSTDARQRIAALDEAAHGEGMLPAEALEEALRDESREVRAKALSAASVRPYEHHARLVARCLSDPPLFAGARNALAVLPATISLEALRDQLDRRWSVDLRTASLRAMKICKTPEAYTTLLEATDGGTPALAYEASASLLAIARHTTSPEGAEPRVETLRSDLLRRACVLLDVLEALPKSSRSLLLRDHLDRTVGNLLSTLVRLAALNRTDSPIETCIHILQTQDKSRRPFVFELLDTLFNPAERQGILPRLERSGQTDPLKEEGRRAAGDSTVQTWLSESLYTEDDWQTAIVLEYILTSDNPSMKQSIHWDRIRKTSLPLEIVEAVKGSERTGVESARTMLTTLEKTFFLKSVPLFEDIPGEELSRVAKIADEESFPAGTTIFREGDHADCLYVIVHGSVSIRKRGHEIAVLARGQSLGEMAVLDSSPRSADAATLDATTLLRVGQEEFMEIMQSNTQIMKGVIRMLLARLRRTDDELAATRHAAPSAS